MQNQPPSNGSVIGAAPQPGFAPPAPGQTAPQVARSSVSSYHRLPNSDKKPHTGVISTVLLLFASLIAILFIYLFIQKTVEYNNIKTDVDAQIDSAVAMAITDNTTKMEEEFAEREKYPFRNFLGPADYGSLGFEYPQTWSVYVAKDAVNGGDFEAYLNPYQVEPVSSTTINALRVVIRNSSFDSVVKTYDNLVSGGKVSFAIRNVGPVTANIYTGDLPSGIRGAVAIFKSRDKTVLIQTDADQFISEFYKILDTVTLIQ